MNITGLKLWHLVIFNAFFDFMGGFIALYSGEGEVFKSITKICSSVLFISFLFFILGDIKNFVVGNHQKGWFTEITIGILSGLLMWFTMILFYPLTFLALDKCNLELCNELLQNTYIIKTAGTLSDLSWTIIILMILKFVILGPIREEILYRTAMLLTLYKRYSLLSSCLIISVVFAVFHLKFFLFTMAFSLLLSALVLIYRSIIPGVIAHGTYNLMIYFILPSKKIIGHYSNLTTFEILLAIFLMGNIFYWSCYVIKRSSLDWLEQS